MSKRKKTRGPRRTSADALERGLAEPAALQVHHEQRIRRLKTKIAVQEELIADAKLDEAKVAA